MDNCSTIVVLLYLLNTMLIVVFVFVFEPCMTKHGVLRITVLEKKRYRTFKNLLFFPERWGVCLPTPGNWTHQTSSEAHGSRRWPWKVQDWRMANNGSTLHCTLPLWIRWIENSIIMFEGILGAQLQVRRALGTRCACWCGPFGHLRGCSQGEHQVWHHQLHWHLLQHSALETQDCQGFPVLGDGHSWGEMLASSYHPSPFTKGDMVPKLPVWWLSPWSGAIWWAVAEAPARSSRTTF